MNLHAFEGPRFVKEDCAKEGVLDCNN